MKDDDLFHVPLTRRDIRELGILCERAKKYTGDLNREAYFEWLGYNLVAATAATVDQPTQRVPDAAGVRGESQ